MKNVTHYIFPPLNGNWKKLLNNSWVNEGGNAEAILKSPTYLSQDAIKVERNFLGSSGFI